MIIKRGWTTVVIPAIAEVAETYRTGPHENDIYHRVVGEVLLPDRENLEVLERVKEEIGSAAFAALYQQEPIPTGGNIIKRPWLRYYEAEPEEFLRLVSSWDLAYTKEETSSYTVGLLWGELDRDYYLLDAVRAKWDWGGLQRRIVEVESRWDANHMIIENTATGKAIWEDLRRTTDLRPILMTSRLDKKARLEAQAARFEAGRVLLPIEADWLQEYEKELLAFPNGSYDDQVDATSQALHFLTGKGAARGGTIRARSLGEA